MLIQSARGMHDVLPGQSALYQKVENLARGIFSLYGYREMRTPVLEPSELFVRALGQTTDVVEKEMFALPEKEGKVLILRPEGTAGVVRAFIENGLIKDAPVSKFFYMGPMFRAERPQKGRTREFVQIGSEYFGNPSPAADCETILLCAEILKRSGLDSLDLRINSLGCPKCRVSYQDSLLKYLRGKTSELCENCRRRIEKNPLRALDCKLDAGKMEDAPRSSERLCPDCLRHYGEVKKYLAASGMEFTESHSLVRGLDYYTRTVFEVYPQGVSGSQDALAAGGRYDTLVKDLGGDDTPAVGFALGVERLLRHVGQKHSSEKRTGVFLASLGAEALEKSFQILNALRAGGVYADGVLNDGQSLKSQMRLADKLGMDYCVIIGDQELKDGSAVLRDLKNQSQSKVPFAELLETLKNVTSEKAFVKGPRES